MTEDKDAERGLAQRKDASGHKFSDGGVQRSHQDVGDFWFYTVMRGPSFCLGHSGIRGNMDMAVQYVCRIWVS